MFQSKEDSKADQLRDFLKLTGEERFLRFLDLSEKINIFPVKKQNNLKHESPYILNMKPPVTHWNEAIITFISLAMEYKVRMILVGGGAVNFHGYQRHSADVDFWIDTSTENLNRLIRVFTEMGYQLKAFPEDVKKKKLNISVKFSPQDLRLELITRFSLNKTYAEAYNESVIAEMEADNKIIRWRVLSYDDLINSKLKSQRPKDMLDIQELERIRNKSKG